MTSPPAEPAAPEASTVEPAEAKTQEEVTEAPLATTAGDEAAPAGETEPVPAAAEDEAAHPEGTNGEEADYGLTVDPDVAFETAQAAAQQLHECLDRLRAGKAATENIDDSEASFAATARTMQLQLLALRRAHRAMAKAADAGRAVEVAARRVADAEHAHLETRIYESTCCRAAARRCRAFPTPQLNKLRPLLEGAPTEEEEEQEEEEGEGEEGSIEATGTDLAAHLEAERVKRATLFEELETLERQKAKDLKAFREVAEVSDDLGKRLRTVEQALEPVCDRLDLRVRPAGLAQPCAEPLAQQLPQPLRLVLAKFDILAAFGPSAGVAVSVEAGGAVDGQPPPEKRARVEAGAAAAAAPAQGVRVELDGAGGQAPKAVLRFACPHHSLVTVAAEGCETLLDGLWPGDDGRQAGLLALLPADEAAAAAPAAGRPYGWAQILAGLRETLLVEAPGLQQADGVTAADVVHRVRARTADWAKSS